MDAVAPLDVLELVKQQMEMSSKMDEKLDRVLANTTGDQMMPKMDFRGLNFDDLLEMIDDKEEVDRERLTELVRRTSAADISDARLRRKVLVISKLMDLDGNKYITQDEIQELKSRMYRVEQDNRDQVTATFMTSPATIGGLKNMVKGYSSRKSNYTSCILFSLIGYIYLTILFLQRGLDDTYRIDRAIREQIITPLPENLRNKNEIFDWFKTNFIGEGKLFQDEKCGDTKCKGPLEHAAWIPTAKKETWEEGCKSAKAQSGIELTKAENATCSSHTGCDNDCGQWKNTTPVKLELLLVKPNSDTANIEDFYGSIRWNLKCPTMTTVDGDDMYLFEQQSLGSMFQLGNKGSAVVNGDDVRQTLTLDLELVDCPKWQLEIMSPLVGIDGSLYYDNKSEILFFDESGKKRDLYAEKLQDFPKYHWPALEKEIYFGSDLFFCPSGVNAFENPANWDSKAKEKVLLYTKNKLLEYLNDPKAISIKVDDKPISVSFYPDFNCGADRVNQTYVQVRDLETGELLNVTEYTVQIKATDRAKNFPKLPWPMRSVRVDGGKDYDIRIFSERVLEKSELLNSGDYETWHLRPTNLENGCRNYKGNRLTKYLPQSVVLTNPALPAIYPRGTTASSIRVCATKGELCMCSGASRFGNGKNWTAWRDPSMKKNGPSFRDGSHGYMCTGGYFGETHRYGPLSSIEKDAPEVICQCDPARGWSDKPKHPYNKVDPSFCSDFGKTCYCDGDLVIWDKNALEIVNQTNVGDPLKCYPAVMIKGSRNTKFNQGCGCQFRACNRHSDCSTQRYLCQSVTGRVLGANENCGPEGCSCSAARKFKIPKLNDIHVKMKKFDYPLIEWNPTYKVAIRRNFASGQCLYFASKVLADTERVYENGQFKTWSPPYLRRALLWAARGISSQTHDLSHLGVFQRLKGPGLGPSSASKSTLPQTTTTTETKATTTIAPTKSSTSETTLKQNTQSQKQSTHSQPTSTASSVTTTKVKTTAASARSNTTQSPKQSTNSDVVSAGNTTVTKTGDCRITVSFDDDDAKSISLTLNQETSASSRSESAKSSAPSGAGVDDDDDDDDDDDLADLLKFLDGLPECYDCDGVERDCKELETLKVESKCHDGKNGDWNLNCIEHQFSGWSCKPCVDCDGTPCDKYWTAQVGEPPLFAHAMLGNGECDEGQPFDGGSSAPQKRLNWKCEEFKFDLYDCRISDFNRKSGCTDCSGNSCRRDLTNSLRRAPHQGDSQCDSADTETSNNFYCPKFDYDSNDCDNTKGSTQKPQILATTPCYSHDQCPDSTPFCSVTLCFKPPCAGQCTECRMCHDYKGVPCGTGVDQACGNRCVDQAKKPYNKGCPLTMVRDCANKLCPFYLLLDTRCQSGRAPDFCNFNCMRYLYDYARCSSSDQTGAVQQETFAKYNSVLISLAMAYWGIWGKFTEYFPFSIEPQCASPHPGLFKQPPQCRYDMLFNDKCDWECYHENCDYDFFGNEVSSSRFYSMIEHCGRPISTPSRGKTMIQFEINNYGGKTPIPDLETVKANRFIAEPNLVLGGVLVRQKRQEFGTCDPGYGIQHEFVTENMQDQCELPANNKSKNMFLPFGADNVFLATSKAFNDLIEIEDCYNVTDKSQTNQFNSPYGFHFMRRGVNFKKRGKGKDDLDDVVDLAGGEGNEKHSYESMVEARNKGVEVQGSYPVYFDARWSQRQANKFTTYMDEGFFLDRNTQELEVTVLTFNGNAQQFLLTDVKFNFESSGMISVDASIKMFRRWPYETATDNFRLGLEILYIILLFYQIFGEIRELAEDIKQTKSCWKGTCSYLCDINNAVDWISMGLSTFGILVWLLVVAGVSQFNPKMRYPVYIVNPSGYDCKSARHMHFNYTEMAKLYDMYDQASAIADGFELYKVVNIFSVLLFMWRFFQILKFQPRLGLVTSTLAAAFTDLAHWGFLAGNLTFLYAFLGTIIFGSQNEAFSNVMKSAETMIFFLLGNNDPAFDVVVNNVYENYEWNRILYFYSYIVIMLFLMLNMFLAIVVDSYEHMKENIEDNVPSVWTDLVDLVTQSYNVFKHKKYSISHEQALGHFDELMHTEAVQRDIQAHQQREKDVSVLNVDGFEVDRSSLKRIITAHIIKDKQSKNTHPDDLMSETDVDPLVNTLLNHFGKTKSRGCCSDNPNKKSEPKIVPLNDQSKEWQQPLEPNLATKVV